MLALWLAAVPAMLVGPCGTRATAPRAVARLGAPADTELRAVLSVAEAAAREAAAVVAAKVGADVIKSKASRGDLLTAVDGEVQRLIEGRVRAAFPRHAFLGEESVGAGPEASAAALRAAVGAVDSEWLWIVDPIDGTTNFVQGLPLVGVSIGVARRIAGTWDLAVGVIADPFAGELFAATAGGGATLDGAPIRVGSEELVDAVVATGFAPTPRSLAPMLRGAAAVGARARALRVLGSAAIMLAWVACGRLSAYFEADLNAWDTAAGALLVREAGGKVSALDDGAPAFDLATRAVLASNAAAHAELQKALAEASVHGLDDEVDASQECEAIAARRGSS